MATSKHSFFPWVLTAWGDLWKILIWRENQSNRKLFLPLQRSKPLEKRSDSNTPHAPPCLIGSILWIEFPMKLRWPSLASSSISYRPLLGIYNHVYNTPCYESFEHRAPYYCEFHPLIEMYCSTTCLWIKPHKRGLRKSFVRGFFSN